MTEENENETPKKIIQYVQGKPVEEFQPPVIKIKTSLSNRKTIISNGQIPNDPTNDSE